MNIEEAKEKLHQLAFKDLNAKPGKLRLQDVYEIIDKIDQQKPEIPRFVANWIEDQKQSFDDSSAIDMYENLTLDNHGGYYHDVWLWAIDHHNDFVFAWTYGYTVKKEKLYNVEIPNPNSDLKVILVKDDGKLKFISVHEHELEEYHHIRNLTAKEICEDFDWAWDEEFTKEVTE
ncbi:DUF1642 domain-containing protein [Streptococcus dysgalactiae subsp. equisimilis]|uniref:DUF1642 domain-containing protein n=1 Tax=Streptococcus dysgalactiae TaxID=1334 RepID=UPI000D90135A|nr:DUF1642 domain-containing protein [Streptococcus dysgalactiae]QBX14181.1 hypothetical protein Javan129_0030 [Streptococcus phage Javan129]QBX14249.1 hypothetical protein Javan131_0034 [Streptococcus phage Javan131]TYL04006.1 DUF1642 domain-containing protein [Streptococcus dysgalactiae]SQB83270.1 Protein of uncharacterised function (DUF1642) [Streptococcus dysgalactiae]